MSLRLKLFLIFGGLLALLVLAQGWLVRSLAQDLEGELGAVAFVIGRSVAEAVGDGEPLPMPPLAGVEEGETDVQVHAFRWHGPGEVSGDEPKMFEHKLIVKLEKGEKEPALALLGPQFMHRIPVPQEGLREKLELFSRRLLLGSLGLLGAGLLVAAVVAHRVARPLHQLAQTAREVGEGALGAQVAGGAGGEVGQAIVAFNRMSDRLRELEARNRELSARRQLGEIGEIARGLAHALRNPLNALGLTVEELAGRAPRETGATELAGTARRQIRRVDQSIRSFLALASEGQRLVQEVDVGVLAEDVALEVLQDAAGRVRLTIDREENLPRLAAVPAELRAVLQALVVNAVEASPDGGQVRLAVMAAETGRVRFEVDDEGPGLPAMVRAELFTPHVSTKANGSGMGLFLAHRIATARYGGRLELLDRQPRGTRAVLEIAARREEAQDG